ncbi:hypothetical protein J6590_029755 [Homalodisca vitripennis]|nr:hypothetical protein J6590_029755 [Homalodisca vitripennis]
MLSILVAGLEDLMTEEEVDSLERSAPSRGSSCGPLDQDDSNSLGSEKLFLRCNCYSAPWKHQRGLQNRIRYSSRHSRYSRDRISKTGIRPLPLARSPINLTGLCGSRQRPERQLSAPICLQDSLELISTVALV